MKQCISLIHWNVEVSVKCGSYHIGVVGGQRCVSLGGFSISHTGPSVMPSRGRLVAFSMGRG